MRPIGLATRPSQDRTPIASAAGQIFDQNGGWRIGGQLKEVPFARRRRRRHAGQGDKEG
jgi:hypothetical protein